MAMKKVDVAGTKNVEVYEDGNYIWLKVDKSQSQGPSKSGKTTVIGTTSGNKGVCGVTIGLNVYK